MMKCSIEDCSDAATAHGLCPKHYMRERRHGDPTVARKRGRKRADSKSITGIVRSLFEDASPRTQARQIRAMTLDRKLQELLGAESYLTEAITAATRSYNGSLNRAKMLRIMEVRAAMLIAQHTDE